MLLLETCLQSCILPVVSGCRRIQSIAHLTIVVELVPEISPLPGIEVAEFLADRAPSEGGIIADVVTPMGTLLGGDDNHTIGTTRTIDGRCRYILQHFYALNISGIKERQRVESCITTTGTCLVGRHIIIDNESVNHIEGLVTTSDTVTATDADDAGCTRLTAGGRDIQTCHSTLKGTLYRGILLFQQLIAYRRDAAGEFQALLCTIAHDYHFVQATSIVYQLNLYWFLKIIDIHIQRAIAHIFYSQGQRRFYLCLQGEVAVDICHDALALFAFHDDGSANQRLTIASVSDMSCDQPLRQGIEGADRNKRCNKQSFYHKSMSIILLLRGKGGLHLIDLFLCQFVIQIQQSVFVIIHGTILEHPLEEMVDGIVTLIIAYADLLDCHL